VLPGPRGRGQSGDGEMVQPPGLRDLRDHGLEFGTVHEQGGIGFMEIGVTVIYIGIFLYTVLFALSKTSLIAKHHPMLEESVHHVI